VDRASGTLSGFGKRTTPFMFPLWGRTTTKEISV